MAGKSAGVSGRVIFWAVVLTALSAGAHYGIDLKWRMRSAVNPGAEITVAREFGRDQITPAFYAAWGFQAVGFILLLAALSRTGRAAGTLLGIVGGPIVLAAGTGAAEALLIYYWHGHHPYVVSVREGLFVYAEHIAAPLGALLGFLGGILGPHRAAAPAPAVARAH